MRRAAAPTEGALEGETKWGRGGWEEAEKGPLAQGSKGEPAREMDASRELPMRLSINGFV